MRGHIIYRLVAFVSIGRGRGYGHRRMKNPYVHDAKKPLLPARILNVDQENIRSLAHRHFGN